MTKTTNTAMNKSVKEMLLDGATEADLMNILKTQIEKAQTEIDEDNKAKAKEAKKAETVAATRKEATIAVINYLKALDLIEDDKYTEEDLNEICEEMKQYEKTLFCWNDLVDVLTGNLKKDKTHIENETDDIIERFLRDLI